MKKLFLLLALLLASVPAHARSTIGAALDLYVATTGSDANTCTISQKCLTLQRAIDYIQSDIDLSGFTATVHVADGAYAGVSVFGGFVGAAVSSPYGVLLSGNTTTPANVVITGAAGAPAFVSSFSAKIGVEGFKTSGPGIYASAAGLVWINGNMDFGAASGNYHIRANMLGMVIGNPSAYTISGTASSHFFASSKGVIEILNTTVTIINTPTIPNFAFSWDGTIYSSGITFSGSLGGTSYRYNANLNGVINTNGGGANYFPGTVGGGSYVGGQYN